MTQRRDGFANVSMNSAWHHPPIAIIGMGCRFPGHANDPNSFWKILREARDVITSIPEERWSQRHFHDPVQGKPGKTQARWGGFVDGLDHFDPRAFGISPREACRMDPQQRMILETAWEALEDGGQVFERLAGSDTAVFVGISGWDFTYQGLSFRDRGVIDTYSNTGGAHSIAANRVSYCFDFRGPSSAVDTACSSALLAVHFACQSIWNGEASLALAGGVNALLLPDFFVAFSQLSMLSPSGRCRAFDASADGFVRGEGAGMVLLKPLEQAIQDRDRIYAVIRGTAVNQDGRTPGMTVPSQEAQQKLVAAACHAAGIEPRQIDYVEAHGTGTLLGDPIEARALGSTLGVGRSVDRPCILGSVKTNIGHLEAGAGVASLMKVALSLYHGLIPPNLHFQHPNPEIDFAQLRLRVPTEPVDWPRRSQPRWAGINAFGYGGTNVHVVLQDAPLSMGELRTSGNDDPGSERVRRENRAANVRFSQSRRHRELARELSTKTDTERAELIPISARSDGALDGYVAKLAQELGSLPAHVSFREWASNAVHRRSHHDYRLAVVAHTFDELRDQLVAFDPSDISARDQVHRTSKNAPRVAFVCSGQGPQWWAMGRALLEGEPVFRNTILRCDKLIQQLGFWSLWDELTADEADSRMEDTAISQPAIFAVQVALAELWRSWGVEPVAVAGHSVGEVAAAHLAGVFELEEAIRVIFQRGRCMGHASSEGGMLAVGMSVEEALSLLQPYGGDVVIAAVNSPSSLTFSGNRRSIESIADVLASRQIFHRRLQVQYAFHSSHMDPIRESLLASLQGLHPKSAQLPMYSTVTGELIAGTELRAEYWWRNVRDPVLFADAMAHMIAEEVDVIIELSPHPVLAAAMNESFQAARQEIEILPSLRRGEAERETILRSAGRLFMMGYSLNWLNLIPKPQRFISLPRYAWQKEILWFESEECRESRHPVGEHPLLGTAVNGPDRSWRNRLDLRLLPYLSDHRVETAAIFPATGFVEIILAAAREILGDTGYQVEDFRLTAPLIFSSEPSHGIVSRFQRMDGTVTIHARSTPSSDDWSLHCTAAVRERKFPPQRRRNLVELRRRCSRDVSRETHYEYCAKLGLNYGPTFQGIEQVWKGQRESVARVVLPEDLTVDKNGYVLHPALLDACFQAVIAADDDFCDFVGPLYLPVLMECLQVHQVPGEQVWVHARITSKDESVLVAALEILGDDGTPLIAIHGLTSHRTAGSSYQEKLTELLYEYRWQPDLEFQLDDSHEPPIDAGIGLNSARTFHQTSETEIPSIEESPCSVVTNSVSGSWLIFSDQQGVGDELARIMRGRGERCIQVFAEKDPQELSVAQYSIAPRDLDDMRMVVEEFVKLPDRCAGIIHLWNLDAPRVSTLDADELESWQDAGVISLLHFVQAWDAAVQKDAGRGTSREATVINLEAVMPRLVIVTSGAQATPSEREVGLSRQDIEVAQSPVLGLGRVLMNEYTRLATRLIDLKAEDPAGVASQLCQELLPAMDAGHQHEDEVAWRGGVRYVQRFMPADEIQYEASSSLPSARKRYRLVMNRASTLDGLEYQTASVEPLPTSDMEIEVRAAALNFSDVMKVLGLYPGKVGENVALGAECSGVITRVGQDVTRFRVGDAVVAVAPHSFGSHVITRSELVALKPDELSFEQAATIPIAFLTARYAMQYLGRLERGERILIHSASGGVGLAAIQLARSIGAEIIATAGTDDKRTYLRRKNIPHVMDSRSLTFADQIMDLTHGRGVDMVLNSLAGEAITRGLEVLGDYGRFLEIGKRDIYRNMHLGLRPFRKNLSFFGIDLDQLMHDRPKLLGRLLQSILDDFQQGRLQPLPHQVFLAAEVVEAFRLMQHGKHIGKVIVSFEDPPAKLKCDPTQSLRFQEKATYLITGGLGGFGIALARWLIDQGARNLVLCGRTGVARPQAKQKIEELQSLGARIVISQVDVARTSEVQQMLQAIRESMPPLRGIFHAAMVLEDGLVQNLDRDWMLRVMSPKVIGGWNLHHLTRDDELDYFVLFSSLSSIFGHAGQANYAAANAFLDQLAHCRRAKDLPCLTVNWGYLEDVGYLAERPQLGERLRRQGVLSFTVRQALDCLQRALLENRTQVSVMNVDWSKWRGLGTGAPVSSRFRHLLNQRDEACDAGQQATLSPASLRQLDKPQRLGVVETLLCDKIAHVLGVSVEKLDRRAPLLDLGLDSLMAVELRNWMEARLQVNYPIVELVRSPSLLHVVERLCDQMTMTKAASQEAHEQATGSSGARDIDAREVLGKIQDLSSDEVDQLLLTLLESVSRHEETSS